MIDPLDAGLAAAGAGFLLDEAADRANRPGQPININVTVQQPEERTPVLINAAEGSTFTDDWDSFIGQDQVKHMLQVYIAAARKQYRALEHVLLASGFPGVGKTTLARIIAKEMGGQFIMLVPPFAVSTLHEAAQSLPNNGVLLIDEIHKMTDAVGARGAESLLHILEEKRLYTDDGVIKLNDITLVGATTDRDKLPETIVNRFPIRPHFARYDWWEMVKITAQFTVEFDVMDVPTDTIRAIGSAAHGIPRRARDLIKATRAIKMASGSYPSPEALLDFVEMDADGLEPIHREYLTSLYQFFGREKDGNWEYVAGEMSMVNLLRETKPGLARIERFLIEHGLIDRTASGRRLTPAGVARAQKILKGRSK